MRVAKPAGSHQEPGGGMIGGPHWISNSDLQNWATINFYCFC